MVKFGVCQFCDVIKDLCRLRNDYNVCTTCCGNNGEDCGGNDD